MLSIAIFVLHFPLASVHHAYAHYEDGGPFSFDPKAADYNNQFISHQAPILVLENVRVIDGMGNAPEEAQTIVIEDGKIIALGATGSIPIPKDAKVISAAGKTVLPGYVMHHEHLYYHSLSQVPGMPYLATPSMVTRLALEPLRRCDHGAVHWDLPPIRRPQTERRHRQRYSTQAGPFSHGTFHTRRP